MNLRSNSNRRSRQSRRRVLAISLIAFVAAAHAAPTLSVEERLANLESEITVRLFGVPMVAGSAHLEVGLSGLRAIDAGVPKSGFDFDAIAGGPLDGLFAGQRQGWSLDAHWQNGGLDVSGEYLHLLFRPDNALPLRRFAAEGWQRTGAYYLVPMKVQAVVRYDSLDQNLSHIGDRSKRWTIGLNYSLKGEALQLRANYIFAGQRDAFAANYDPRLITRLQVVY